MSQVVSCRPFTTANRVRVRAIPCAIYDGHICTGTRSSPCSSVSSCQRHSTNYSCSFESSKLLLIEGHTAEA
jgi:hypothetical protein